ncbi:peroxiredoxin [Granulosicoccus sp. 3-233]|uniref:peroxiredoxin n=1 Tax=Granulosicoccus sp. 3-233 TaxID=3417969 RepID=UPI003D347FA8
MSTPELNKPAPAFDLPATGERNISLSSLKGSKVVLYFYPRDATPGCTTESQNFRDAIDAFTAAGAVILGVSQDNIKSHEKFKAKHEMPFDLLSDSEDRMCRDYAVIKLKKMYGKEFEGIERSTFLIDEKGVLRQEWRKVKVPGHVDEVLAAVQALD